MGSHTVGVQQGVRPRVRAAGNALDGMIDTQAICPL